MAITMTETVHDYTLYIPGDTEDDPPTVFDIDDLFEDVSEATPVAVVSAATNPAFDDPNSPNPAADEFMRVQTFGEAVDAVGEEGDPDYAPAGVAVANVVIKASPDYVGTINAALFALGKSKTASSSLYVTSGVDSAVQVWQ